MNTGGVYAQNAGWAGLLYQQTGIPVGASDSGAWRPWPILFLSGSFRLVGTIGVGESLTLVLEGAWDSSGAGSDTVHTFSPVLTNGAPNQSVVIPGASGAIVSENTTSFQKGPAPPFWRLAFTGAGGPVDLSVYATLMPF